MIELYHAAGTCKMGKAGGVDGDGDGWGCDGRGGFAGEGFGDDGVEGRRCFCFSVLDAGTSAEWGVYVGGERLRMILSVGGEDDISDLSRERERESNRREEERHFSASLGGNLHSSYGASIVMRNREM